MDNKPLSAIRPADLSDPFYYLHNARTLLNWVMQVHPDLLLTDEHQQLKQLLSLPEETQALLFRMVMRKGEWFRNDQLNYAEIPQPTESLEQLAQARLIDPAACCNAATLSSLCRKDELLQVCQSLWPEQSLDSKLPKRDLQGLLVSYDLPEQPLADWWPQAPFTLIRLSCMPLMDRMRLMFFGNLHQDWSEFVVTELGHQRYESLPMDSNHRAFSQRSEVDLYLLLHRVQQQLDEGIGAHELYPLLPEACQTDWLEQRRQKLAFALGQAVERSGDLALALELYQANPHREARIRHLRVLEKTASAERTRLAAEEAMDQVAQPEARVRIQRILQRSAKKSGCPINPQPKTAIPQFDLRLTPSDSLRVEALVIEQLRSEGLQAWHVENRLFTGLFALLFWPALYAPVKGAFFHPFQSGPADLYQPDFVLKRQPLIDAGFRQLADGDYRASILRTMQQKRGIRCDLVHWPSLDTMLVSQALEYIPAEHLNAIFRHLLLDLRHHRRGLPDLICLNPQQNSYQLIEVKGPNDRLQDHQRLWLEFFIEQGITANLCQVRFPA